MDDFSFYSLEHIVQVGAGSMLAFAIDITGYKTFEVLKSNEKRRNYFNLKFANTILVKQL